MLTIWTLISGIGGSVFGAIVRMIDKAQQARIDERKALMAKAGVIIDDTQHARSKAGSLQFGRRTIVITFMLILVAPVVLTFMNPSMVFNIPVDASQGSFSFLFGLFKTGDVQQIKYIAVQGMVLFAPIYDMAFFIVGYYVGSGGSSHARF